MESIVSEPVDKLERNFLWYLPKQSELSEVV
jgi:hypothetical protein